MTSFLQSGTFHLATQILIGSVWVFHGFYSKILNGIPRHRLIVGKVLRLKDPTWMTRLIGLAEVTLGIWVFTGWQPIPCAAVQTCALVGMNTLEILIAKELLLSALGMVLLNAGLIGLAWYWALCPPVR